MGGEAGDGLTREVVWERVYIPALAKAAMEQTEKRLADYLEIRRATEAKMMSLFGVFVSVSMAIFGLAAALAQRGGAGLAVGMLGVAGLIFLSSAVVIGLGLRPGDGALLGGTPDFWLGRDALHDADEKDDEAQAARHFAVAALDFDRRCAIQIAENRQRHRILGRALRAALCAAVAFGVAMALIAASAR